ncbi:MAG: hypothetical protein B6D37_05125 [Sphingobacteriales bacterium UTBCD1]|jgi:hypothetical protein|nr:MAG: hypothetical protein B6D37_05125 [Sphingobacteriales bacterium UTBCD1]
MATKIKNLDSLEKEIYRLRLEAKNYEGKLEENLDHLQKNYASMTFNTVFSRSPDKESGKERIKEKIFSSIWENERIRSGIDKIIGHLADRASEGIESLIDKILHRKD